MKTGDIFGSYAMIMRKISGSSVVYQNFYSVPRKRVVEFYLSQGFEVVK